MLGPASYLGSAHTPYGPPPRSSVTAGRNGDKQELFAQHLDASVPNGYTQNPRVISHAGSKLSCWVSGCSCGVSFGIRKFKKSLLAFPELSQGRCGWQRPKAGRAYTRGLVRVRNCNVGPNSTSVKSR